MSTDPAAQLRHELRTPLNHIVGYAELLLEQLEGGADPELVAGLGALRADARRVLACLNEALERRVAEQVAQLERLGRLKRFFSPRRPSPRRSWACCACTTRRWAA